MSMIEGRLGDIRFLLGEKEFSLIHSAYEKRMSGLVLERSLSGMGSVRISMRPPDRAWGETPWLIRVEKTRRNLYSTQYFGSVAEFEQYWKG